MKATIKNAKLIEKAQSKVGAERPWTKVTVADPDTYENLNFYGTEDFRFPANVELFQDFDIVVDIKDQGGKLRGNLVSMTRSVISVQK